MTGRRALVKRAVLASGLAWLVMAGVVLGRFADAPLPVSYLIRPLIAAAIVAIVIGCVSLMARRYAPSVAVLTALLVVAPGPWALLMLAAVLAAEYLRWRGWDSRAAVPIVVAAFFGVGLVQAVGVAQLFPTSGPADAHGPPMYVILLDGYPRLDSLASLGIDNQPFVDALAARGFDHYEDARSIHTRTHKTLLAMLTTESVNDEPVTVAERRAIRGRLAVPLGFVALDPPIGFVTLGPGPHVDPGGINDFEVELIGVSALGVVAPDTAWALVLESLRDRLMRTLDLIASTDEPRVFAHLMAPHPPFLLGPDGSDDVPRWCWPGCGAFTSTIEGLSITREQWAAGMRSQLGYLNARLLDTVDEIANRHPDAVIVLFGDHGGRYSDADSDERHRPFLAARTPGHPRLFDESPRPDTIIRTLMEAYP